MRLILLVFATLLGIGAGYAQSLEEVDRRQAALIEAWQKTPLTIRRALFIEGEPRGFGLYQERPSKDSSAARRSSPMPNRSAISGKRPARACSN
jgi:hypothetical protein